MRQLTAALLAICSWHSALAAVPPPPPAEPALVLGNPACVSCGSALDGAALERVTAKALAGDPEAAFRISAHFSSIDRHAEGLAWELRAAEAGQAVAQYNQWFRLRESAACPERLQALSWLERSAAGGFPNAQAELPHFKQVVAPCKPQVEHGASLPPNNSSKPTPLRGAA